MSKRSISDLVDFNPKRILKKGSHAPFVSMSALPESSRNITEVYDREFKGGGSKFRNGDTLFARITPCLENGKTAKVSVLDEEDTGHGSTEFIVMSAKNSSIDEDYVYYLARLPEFREYARSRMEGTSGRQRVSWQSLSEFEFYFPRPFYRKYAGKILKQLDDKIQKNHQINKTLEQMAQAIFKSWFVDFEPVKAKNAALEAGGSEEDALIAAMSAISGKDADQLAQMQSEQYAELRATAELFPSEMQDSELGEIPEGWNCLSLDEVAKYKNGLALQKFRPDNEDVFLPVVKIAQLRKGYADGEEKASPDINPECIIDNGDVVFSWSGSLIVDTWCGGKAALNQHLFKITSKKHPKWLYFHFTRHHLEEFQRTAEDKAVTMGHIKREHLKQALCAIPGEDFIKKIGCSLHSILEKRIELRLETTTLSSLRDTLLPKLLSGELSVPDAEAAVKAGDTADV